MRSASGLAVLCAVVGAACGDSEPLRVGFAVPVHWYRAARMALEEMPGAPVVAIWDTLPGMGGGAGGAVYWADWHVGQEVDVVIGHDASRPSVGAAAVYNREGILQLAPVATSGLLERQGPWAFGLVPNGAGEGRFIAAFADTVLGARRVAIMYNNDEFGVDLREGVARELASRGVSVVDERFFSPITEGGTEEELRPLFAAAMAARPDVIVLAGREIETFYLMRYLRGVSGAPRVISSDAALVRSPGVRRFAPALEGLYVVRLWSPERPAARAFARRFAERWGEDPDGAEAMTYDATRMVLAAATDGARTAAGVRGWLMQLGRDRPPFAGLSADLAFRDRRPFGAHLWMVRVEGGALVPVDTVP